MSTVSLTYRTRRGREGAGAAVRSRSELTPRALALALLAVVMYAAFAHGAVAESTNARIEVTLAAITSLAAAAWLWTGTLRFAAPRIALGGTALLAAFALWNGVTVFWSVAPDQTWIELNRALSYLLVLCLAIALGATERRASAWVAQGFAAIALVVTCYALGQKLFPGVRIGGLIDLNQTGAFPRLQEPLGYWNALALFLVFGIPPALAVAVDRARGRGTRLGALVAMQLMLVAIGLTYSRGGLIVLAVALAVAIGLGGRPLRSLMWLAIAAGTAIPALVVGLTSHALNTANVALSSRESSGLVLLPVLLASVLALVLVAWRLQAIEARHQIGPSGARRITRLLVAGVGVLLVAGVLAIALSSRGITGTASHVWNGFTTTRVTSNYDPGRLLSADSENRWVWWKEAAGAFSDRPLLGWGAGSFAVVHLLYRQNRLSVTQPHSVPLQFLAETGLVGAVLALSAFLLLLVSGLRRIASLPRGSDRMLAAALLAGTVAYLVHGFYDWDWNIPGVSLPAMLFLGVVVATPRELPRRRTGPGARGLLLGAVTLCLCTFALSAALPSLAASKAANALLAAGGAGSAEVEHAAASAEMASRLDPLSDAGLRVEATLAVRQGDVHTAVRDLVAAVNRQPSDASAWQELAFLELQHGNYRDGMLAASRLLELDPHSISAKLSAHNVAAAVNLSYTPPRDSATAQGLPPG